MTGNRIALGGLMCLLGLTTPLLADEEADAFHDDGEGYFDVEEPGEPIQTGFVFLDGEYLSPPYELTLPEEGGTVILNGQPLPGIVLRASRESDHPRERRGPFRDAWGTARPSSRRYGGWSAPGFRELQRIRYLLEDNGSVVAFTDQRLQALDGVQSYVLLKTLLDFDPDSERYQELIDIPRQPEAVAVWETWLREFSPSPEFRRRAGPIVEKFDTAEAENFAQAAAVQRLDKVAFPLTLVGMVLSVIAFGHLLMSLPNGDAMRRGAEEGESGLSGEVVRATLISVGLVAVLSGLDLAWTLLASQAGQMRELNPIASHFINDPMSLVAFKATATLLGCGLLYALRWHGRAQWASWWMCLVCTMLTFRWLMFNSMFIS